VVLYNDDIEPDKSVRILSKLKREYIFLISSSEMRIELAVQVGSNVRVHY